MGKGGKAWGAPPSFRRLFSPFPDAPPIQNQSRLFSGLGVGEEELLAFKLEAGDGLLGIGADPPVDELLLLLHFYSIPMPLLLSDSVSFLPVL